MEANKNQFKGESNQLEKIECIITIEKNITYITQDNYRYKINENNDTYIKIWNKTLRKYLELIEENNKDIQQTLLYNFIQNNSITIER